MSENVPSLSVLTDVVNLRVGKEQTNVSVVYDVVNLAVGSWMRKGDPGPPGSDGEPGREVILRQQDGWIQWQYEGDSVWLDLISVADLQGPKGDPGLDGVDGREVELNKSSTHIQWRYEGEELWLNLVALNELKGDEGDPGEGVPTGGDTGQVLAKNSNDDYDTTWVDPADEATWGNISGTLSDQTDLQDALDLKANDAEISVVGKTNDYDDLDNKPAIPDVSQFETSTQLDARDEANRERANHTGVQDVSTITGLADVAVSGSYNDLTDLPSLPDVSQFETTTQLNDRDTANRDRTNHTGTQTASTISDFQTTVSANTDVQANTAKRTYPLEDEQKLATIETGAQVNVTPDATDISYNNEDSELEADNVQDAIDELRTLLPIPLGDWSIANLAPGWIDLFSGQPVDLGTDGFCIMAYRIENNMVKGFVFGVVDTDNNMGAVNGSLWIIQPSVLPAIPSNVQGFAFAIPSKFGYMSVFPDEENPGVTGLFAPAFPDLSGGLEDYASMAFVGDLPVNTTVGFETLQYNGRLVDLTGRFATFQTAFEYPIQGTFIDGGDIV